MRKQVLVFLVLGFAIGFAIFYPWTKQRAPDIVRAIPLPAGAVTEQEAAEPAAPPPDPARVERLQAELRTNPKNFEALVEMANIHFDQKNFEDAIGLYSRALEVRPDMVNVRTDLGTALFYANRHDDAIAEFKRALELDPTHPQTLFNIGVAFLHGKNDVAGALQYWEKLVALNPNYPQVELVKEQIRVLREQQRTP